MSINVKTLQKVIKPLLKAHGFSFEKQSHSGVEGQWIVIVRNLSSEKKQKLKQLVEKVVDILGDDFSINSYGEVRFDGTTVCNYWEDGKQYRFYNY